MCTAHCSGWFQDPMYLRLGLLQVYLKIRYFCCEKEVLTLFIILILTKFTLIFKALNHAEILENRGKKEKSQS